MPKPVKSKTFATRKCTHDSYLFRVCRPRSKEWVVRDPSLRDASSRTGSVRTRPHFSEGGQGNATADITPPVMTPTARHTSPPLA